MFEDIVSTMWYSAAINATFSIGGLVYGHIKRIPCYHPIILFQIYFLLGFGLRPVAILIDQGSHVWDRIGLDLSAIDGAHATLVAAIFWTAFTIVGFYITLQNRPTNLGYIINPESLKYSFNRPKLFEVLAYTLIIIGTIVTWKMIANRGTSIYSFETEIDAQGKQRMVGQSGYFTMIAEWPIIGILLLILKRGVNVSNSVIIVLFFILRMYVGAQRLSFVAVAIMLCFYLVIKTKRTWPQLKYIGPAIAMLTIFNIVGSDRLLLQRIVDGQESPSAFFEKKDSKMSSVAENTAHFVEFDMLCETVHVVPQPLGYNYFTQYLRIFVWPIPRQLWKEKPVETGLVNFDKLGNFYALTISCIGDSYSNLGTWGTWVMAAVWAWSLGIIFNKMRNRPSCYVTILFFSVCGYVSTIFRDGGVTAIYFILVTIVPAYIIVWLCRPSRPPAKSNILTSI